MTFSICPRCGDRAFESLTTHSFCVACNYSPVFEEIAIPVIPEWAVQSLSEYQDQEELAEDMFAQAAKIDSGSWESERESA